MFNKRGQELSTGTIILLIVGIIILVLLVLGFTSGWSKVFPFLAKPNLDQVESACSSACTTGSVTDYCLSGRSFIPQTGNKLNDATCYYLATKSIINGCEVNCDNKAKIYEFATIAKLSEVKQLGSSQLSLLKAACKGSSVGMVIQTRVNYLGSTDQLYFYTCTAEDIK